jgi:uncharacterized phage protein (TIGR02220 family)
MHKDKKGFIIYKDSYETIQKLTINEKAELLTAMFDYSVMGKTEKLTRSVDLVFSFMKRQFDRDNQKYDKICERNRENGLKGGRPKEKENNPENPVGYLETQTNPKKPIIDNREKIKDKEKDKVKDKGKEKECQEVIDHLNKKTNRSYKLTSKHQSLISARLKDYTVRQLKDVINIKFNQWNNDQKMSIYLRPETLFNATKFESYIQEVPDKEAYSFYTCDEDLIYLDGRNLQ